jgi:hypothetical protein
MGRGEHLKLIRRTIMEVVKYTEKALHLLTKINIKCHNKRYMAVPINRDQNHHGEDKRERLGQVYMY